MVSGYWPMRGELDPRPALLALAAAGHPLCLPVVAGKGQAPDFPGLDAGRGPGAGGLRRRGAGAREPAPAAVAACWCRCWPSTGAATAWATAGASTTGPWRRCAAPGRSPRSGWPSPGRKSRQVPAEATDERLDWIVTEREALSLRAAAAERLMRLLFCGDINGRSGREVLAEHLPRLRDKLALDFVIVNGENAAGGFGITEKVCQRDPRPGRGRHHRRQSLLGPAGGPDLHRPRAAPAAAAELPAGHAGPRRRGLQDRRR